MACNQGHSSFCAKTKVGLINDHQAIAVRFNQRGNVVPRQRTPRRCIRVSQYDRSVILF